LLIAGVSGCKSLIESAKLQKAIGELRNFRTAFNAFYERYDRLPGDFNNDGKITEEDNGKFYTTGEYANVNIIAGPGTWVELYVGGFWKFHPLPNKLDAINNYGTGEPIFPYLKINKNINSNGVSLSSPWYERFGIMESQCSVCRTTITSFFYKTKGNYVVIETDDIANVWMIPSQVSTLDKKMDDGVFNTGEFRAKCGVGAYVVHSNDNCRKGTSACNKNYDALDDKTDGCGLFIYSMGF
jgi:hypothetical protein